MAKGKQNKVLMVPEDSPKSFGYSYTVEKSKAMLRGSTKLRMRKYDPSQRKHVWFIERKLPTHSK